VGACALGDSPTLGSLESEIRICADGPVVEGIDVSKWQAGIDWNLVADDGIRFAIIRVNHGLDDIDERFAYNWAEARRVGVIRGAYQYFLPDEDPIEQAELLLSLMGPLEPDDLPPVIDVEEAAGQSPETIRQAIHLWSDTVEAAIGRKPFIYTAKYFWQDGVGAPDDFLDHPLWVANYNVDCPLIADPWPRWNIWQYTSTGRVDGVTGNVDRDHFNGTYEELIDFALGLPDPDPEPDPDPDPEPEPDPDPEPDPTDPAAPAACSAGSSGGAAVPLLLALALLGKRRRTRRFR
jgi:lysozyme